MTVEELIDKLREFPGSLPITCVNDINPQEAKDPNSLNVNLAVWTHTNYPYDKPDFLYVNID